MVVEIPEWTIFQRETLYKDHAGTSEAGDLKNLRGREQCLENNSRIFYRLAKLLYRQKKQ
jgi:hypothetical protein